MRHIIEMQNPEKRCGRPSKYPVNIPVPRVVSLMDSESLAEIAAKFVYRNSVNYSGTVTQTSLGTDMPLLPLAVKRSSSVGSSQPILPPVFSEPVTAPKGGRGRKKKIGNSRKYICNYLLDIFFNSS